MEIEINNYFGNIFKEVRLSLSLENTADTALELEEHSLKLCSLYDSHLRLTELMNKLQIECQNKAVEIRDEIETQKKYDEEKSDKTKFEFLFKNKNKNLSWGDMSDIEDKRNNLFSESEKMETFLKKPIVKTKKTLEYIEGVKLPKEITFKTVSNLNNIPNAINWYTGDKKNKAGLYIRVSQNLFVRVPFPNLIDSTKNQARNNTIKCKYETKERCIENQKFLSDRYNTDTRDCTYAHVDDKYIRVGNIFRCPSMPGFGSHDSLSSDFSSIKPHEIKLILMNSLSDLLLCYLWDDWHKSDERIIFNNIDICQ